MNFLERASAAVLAVSLLSVWPGAAHAMGVGRPSTRALLGDTLRLTVPLRLEPGEQVNDDCLSADVYFGDDKVAAAAVSVSLLPTEAAPPQAAQALARTLLVRTTALINEPVVTVYLSAGCEARITRKIVALADPPSSAISAPAAMSPASPAPDRLPVSLPVTLSMRLRKR